MVKNLNMRVRSKLFLGKLADSGTHRRNSHHELINIVFIISAQRVFYYRPIASSIAPAYISNTMITIIPTAHIAKPFLASGLSHVIMARISI